MDISKCTLADVDEVVVLYQAARDLQTERKMVVWPGFANSFIEKEIDEGRQWKMVADNVIACNWVITFQDKEIWGDKDQDNSIYIHRICTNPGFRGNRFINHIADWARGYARQLGKRFIRLDTLGENKKLIKHYTSAGFNFLGMCRLTDTAALPKHYQDEPNCCLFEIDLMGE